MDESDPAAISTRGSALAAPAGAQLSSVSIIIPLLVVSSIGTWVELLAFNHWLSIRKTYVRFWDKAGRARANFAADADGLISQPPPVPRTRNPLHFAAHSRADFGFEGHDRSYQSGVVLVRDSA